MSYFENLWEKFHDLQVRQRGATSEQVDQMRDAFYTGAWCHMAFVRRIRGLQGEVAAEVLRDLEDELFAAVAPPVDCLRTVSNRNKMSFA
jgi:hypothetical protein